MIKFEYKGDVYFIEDHAILDEHRCYLYDALREEVAVAFIKSIGNTRPSEVPDIIDFLRENNAYNFAIKIILKYMESYATLGEKRHFLPIATSLYRKINKPTMAIKLFNKYNSMYGAGIQTVALLTSVAAAYLDINDLVESRHYCNWAYARERDSKYNKNEHYELTMVYARLKKAEEMKR